MNPRTLYVPALRLAALLLALGSVSLLLLGTSPTGTSLLLLAAALACLTLSLLGNGAAQELELEWRTISQD